MISLLDLTVNIKYRHGSISIVTHEHYLKRSIFFLPVFFPRVRLMFYYVSKIQFSYQLLFFINIHNVFKVEP